MNTPSINDEQKDTNTDTDTDTDTDTNTDSDMSTERVCLSAVCLLMHECLYVYGTTIANKDKLCAFVTSKHRMADSDGLY